MSHEHFNAFLNDVQRINPRITVEQGIFSIRTSLSGLIETLRNQQDVPRHITSVNAALALCDHPNERRLQKYVPAIERLISVWGRGFGRTYPVADNFVHVTPDRREAASQSFMAVAGSVPAPVRPAYAELLCHDLNPMSYNVGMGAGYLHRYTNAREENIDITARSLLLKAGLFIPEHGSSDNGYAASLGLGLNNFEEMRNSDIIDIGCGASIFGAEMNTLFGANVVGVDLNVDQVENAMAEGARRYAKGMMYLKMQNDMQALARTTVPPALAPLINQLVNQMTQILAAYTKPIAGDVFKLANDRRGPIDDYDFAVSLNLFCYFNAEEQLVALNNICSVTTRGVFLFSGYGHGLPNPRLNYSQAEITQTHNCEITQISEQTHHIRFRE